MDIRKQAEEVITRMPDAGLREAIEQVAAVDPVIWCRLHRKIHGRSLSFDSTRMLAEAEVERIRLSMKKHEFDQEMKWRLLFHRPFLVQPLRDPHQHKAKMKGRQIGDSENTLNETIWWLATHPGRKVILTFPRNEQLQQFSETRIAKAFTETPRMKNLIGTPNAVRTKKIGESYLLLRSGWEANLGEGIDADMVVFDELDRMKPGIQVAFEQSLRSSPFGLVREISTPTLPGRGIHKSFEKSDQQTWLVRCHNGHEQEIEYPTNLIQVKDIKPGAKELPENSYSYLCRLEKCRKPLDRMKGRWVPKHPDLQKIRGYHLPQLIAPWLSATEIMQEKIKWRWPNLFYNYVLGLPASSQDTLLNARDYEACCAEHDLSHMRTSEWRDVIAGIDWGNENWVVVTARNIHNGRLYVIGIAVFEDDAAEELRSVKAIENYLAPFQPDMTLADAGYGKDRNAYLLRRFGEGKVFAVSYNPNPKNSRTFRPVWNQDTQARVLVDRTMTLKSTCRAIKEMEIGLPSYEDPMALLLKEHIQALAPMKELDEDGEIIEVIAARGPDHLAHALGYSLLGQERLAEVQRFSFDFGGP